MAYLLWLNVNLQVMALAMKVIDLNADIGEADNAQWADAEARILSAISSANIACGGHAGNDTTMRQTVRAAKENGVTIGAHPAFPDRKNFGRQSLNLGDDISEETLTLSLIEQVTRLAEIAYAEGTSISYVKPHGALYNDAVIDPRKAEIIIKAVKSVDPTLTLLGGPESEMMRLAHEEGINFVAEGFIDRRYTDKGHLLSRSKAGAVLETDAERIAQALSLAKQETVTTDSGKKLFIRARSLCLHGDSEGAVSTAFKARKALEDAQIIISPFVEKALI